jgi:hypothetical protein
VLFEFLKRSLQRLALLVHQEHARPIGGGATCLLSHLEWIGTLGIDGKQA